MKKKNKEKVSTIKKDFEGPIEAGQTQGISLQEVLDNYLDERNVILSLLRVYFDKSSTEVASELGISKADLEKIEKSKDLVPYQLVPKIAKLFDVDLKTLLMFLGHANLPASNHESDDSSDFPLAAQYSGPELTRQEKIDLQKLIAIIVEHKQMDKDTK